MARKIQRSSNWRRYVRVCRRALSTIVGIGPIVIPRRVMQTMTVTELRVIRIIHMRMGLDRLLARSFGDSNKSCARVCGIRR